MLKLKHLRFSGIGRFVDAQNIDFEELGNLIQVDGENRNTGGSSGAGKTTVFNALDYLFGLNDLATTVLQSRLTKDPISVRGVFDFDGKPLMITRSKKGLIIDLDNQVTEGSSKITEEKLDQIIGMPRDLFRKILHKRQKEGGFFLNFTPKEMYEFLSDTKGLAEELKKLEKVEKKLSELEEQKKSRQSDIISIQSALQATQESILALGMPPIRDIHQSVILELKGKYDVSNEKFKQVQEEQTREAQELEKSRPIVGVSPYSSTVRDGLEKRRKELDLAIGQLIVAERDRQSKVRSTISEKSAEQSKLSYQIRDSDAAKVHATELAAQVKKIRDSICPTCERPEWVTELSKSRESELLSKLAECKEKILAGATALERQKILADELIILNEQVKPITDPLLPGINEEIADITQLLKEEKAKEADHLLQQNTENSEKLRRFAVLQNEQRAIHDLNIAQVRGQADIDRRALEAAVAKLKAYDDAKNRYDSSLAQMKAKESEYIEKLAKANLSVELIEKNIEEAEELRKAVKLFISCSFDDALEAIGNAATKIIRCIPTMSNATIQFESQKENKDGKIKEEVNAVLSIDGEVGVPIKSLSGGERSSTDLAVDLAVIDFIELETGKGIDAFILDEPFTGLDTVSIEMALEVLRNSNSTKRLIVVDHNPEVKQMVSSRIVVVRDGSTSNIEAA